MGYGRQEVNLQVLQVASGERNVGNDNNLSIALLGDLDGLAEVTDTAVDLDLVMKELLESGNVEDLVRCGLGRIDDKL